MEMVERNVEISKCFVHLKDLKPGIIIIIIVLLQFDLWQVIHKIQALNKY